MFGPCLLWPNGWMDQDVSVGLGTGHVVLNGDPASPPQKKVAERDDES